jgi:hypothetical protein
MRFCFLTEEVPTADVKADYPDVAAAVTPLSWRARTT